MSEKVPLLLTVEQRLRQIDLGYQTFLREAGLVDTDLAKMSYFSNVKKAYLKDPLQNEDHQARVILYLDEWMAEIKKAVEVT